MGSVRSGVVSCVQVVFPGGPVHQSPPSSSGGFLLLPGGQPRPGDSGGSPNSTPGLQTPTPAATPVSGAEPTGPSHAIKMILN